MELIFSLTLVSIKKLPKICTLFCLVLIKQRSFEPFVCFDQFDRNEIYMFEFFLLTSIKENINSMCNDAFLQYNQNQKKTIYDTILLKLIATREENLRVQYLSNLIETSKGVSVQNILIKTKQQKQPPCTIFLVRKPTIKLQSSIKNQYTYVSSQNAFDLLRERVGPIPVFGKLLHRLPTVV